MLKPLIYNTDIRKLHQKAKTRNLSFDEVSMLQDSKLSEEQIQSNCKRYIDGLDKELSLKKLGRVKFVQIDNGGATFKNKYSKFAKARQGTVSGFPDVMIICFSEIKCMSEIIFIEFKRIGIKSKISPRENQIKQKEELQSMKIFSCIINNSLYFEKYICDKIRKFVNGGK